MKYYNKTKCTKEDRVSYCNDLAIDNPTDSYIRYELPIGLFRNHQRKVAPMRTPIGLAYAIRVIYQGQVDNE